jgi:hypothetical protein
MVVLSISANEERLKKMRPFVRICNNLMTQTSFHSIKVGSMLIPAYSIIWLALRISSLFFKEQ